MNKIQPAYWLSLAVFGFLACSIFVAKRPQLLEFVIPLVGFVGFFVVAHGIWKMMKEEKNAPVEEKSKSGDE